jgi:hypothetical protein
VTVTSGFELALLFTLDAPPFLGEACDIEFDIVPYLEAMDSLSFGYAVNPSLRAWCKGDCPPCAHWIA